MDNAISHRSFHFLLQCATTQSTQLFQKLIEFYQAPLLYAAGGDPKNRLNASTQEHQNLFQAVGENFFGMQPRPDMLSMISNMMGMFG